MNSVPRLSIGLPVYNGGNFLAESFEALLGQSYEDFELIISDNASTDDTANICQRYAKQDSRIRYIRQPHNIGLSPNHQFVARQARGEFFKMASHDDLYARDLMKRSIDVLDDHPEAVLAHSWEARIDPNGDLIKGLKYSVNAQAPRASDRFRSMLMDGWDDYTYGVIRTKVLMQTHLWGSHHLADRTINTELSLYGPFQLIPDWLYFRREHPGRTSEHPERTVPYTVRTRSAGLDPRRADRLRHPAVRLYAEYVWGYMAAIQCAPLSPKERQQCYRHLARWLAWRFLPVVLRTFEAGALHDTEHVLATVPDVDIDSIVARRTGRTPVANDRRPEQTAVPPVTATMPRREPVLVIGAGSSGLAAAVELQRQGVPAEILERNDTIGSAWRTRYDRLRLNTCRWNSVLSREPFSKGTPAFPLRDDFISYLGSYAESHRLSVQFGVEVKRIDRGDGKWRLATSAGERTVGQIIIATGCMHTPWLPDWPGLDLYSGRLLHSAEYRNAEPFRNADVLVVGAGSSAMDIATNLAHGGAGRVRVAVRSQPNLMRRAPLGLPADLLFSALFRLPPQRADGIDRILRRITIGTLVAQGLTVPDEGSYTRARRTGSGPTIADKAIFQAIKSGRIEIVAGVSSVDADGVRLIDGNAVRPDVIIAATGFTPGLAELVGHLDVLDDRGWPLVSGGSAALPGLRFTGFVANIRSQYKDALCVAEQVAHELIRGSQ